MMKSLLLSTTAAVAMLSGTANGNSFDDVFLQPIEGSATLPAITSLSFPITKITS